MKQTLVVHKDNKPIYNIEFDKDFSRLFECMEQLNIRNRKVCIVSDSRVASFYLEKVKQIFIQEHVDVTQFVFPEGEASKNLNTVKDLYTHLIEKHFERGDLLLALGGGVVGDLTGYTAATYLRGIDFVQVPTSLLAQVDSSIGGKTGVDFDCYKNMVGSFHQPKLVYMNVSTLKTLSEKQFLSGMGEIIKHGLIKDQKYFQWILDHEKEIKCQDIETLAAMIYQSCDIKRKVVEEDPTEKGERALLNYGHTLGHAIEKLTNFQYLHGECVAVGCMLAAKLDMHRGNLLVDDYNKIVKAFDLFQMPKITEYKIDQVLETVKSDKKMSGGKIKFILLHNIGQAYIDKTVSDDEMKAVLEENYETK